MNDIEKLSSTIVNYSVHQAGSKVDERMLRFDFKFNRWNK